MMVYIATFFTHSGAIKYEKFMRQNEIKVELMPVPRKYSSNCGISAKFNTENDIRNYISDDIEKLYEIRDGEGVLIYKAEL